MDRVIGGGGMSGGRSGDGDVDLGSKVGGGQVVGAGGVVGAMRGGGGTGKAWHRVSILAAESNKELMHFLPAASRASVQVAMAARARRARILAGLGSH